MFDEKSNTTTIRRLLPSVAIALVYAGFIGLPMQRQIGDVEFDTEQKSVELQMLSLQEVAMHTPELNPDDSPVNSRVVDEYEPPSIATTLANLISVFHLHGIECTVVKAEGHEVLSTAKTILQRMTLRGSFLNMLDAVDTIESDIPGALLVEFNMERLLPEEPCRWEIAFQFEVVK